jgi:hypothetical protein
MNRPGYPFFKGPNPLNNSPSLRHNKRQSLDNTTNINTLRKWSVYANRNFRDTIKILESDIELGDVPDKTYIIQNRNISVSIIDINFPRAIGFLANYMYERGFCNTFMIVFSYGIVFHNCTEWKTIWFENVVGKIIADDNEFTISTLDNKTYRFIIDNNDDRNEIMSAQYAFNIRLSRVKVGGKRKTKRRANRSKKTQKRR